MEEPRALFCIIAIPAVSTAVLDCVEKINTLLHTHRTLCQYRTARTGGVGSITSVRKLLSRRKLPWCWLSP
eukprot:1391818-Rhodomonas_salina.1